MSCPLCDTVVGTTSLERKSHAKTVHGFPQCGSCKRTILNLRMFETHLQEPHPLKKCTLNSCSDQVGVGCELEHATSHHGFPICQYCNETFQSNYLNFYRHVESHRHDLRQCSECPQLFTEWQERQHAITHGYPICPKCKKSFTTIPNFYTHAALHPRETPEPQRKIRRLHIHKSPEDTLLLADLEKILGNNAAYFTTKREF